VRIGGRALDILTVLVERPGEVIGKRDLIARVWPGVQVEDGNLKVNMAMLRRVLDPGADGVPYIATVVGRGYRFAAPVRHSPFPARPGDEPTPTPRPHNLPSPATRIVGRDGVIDGLLDTLFTSRLVSVVGPGGVGKTTVALAVARRAAAGHKDGAWLVDLAPLREAGFVADAIATAIGLRAHSANMLAALTGFLGQRDIHLVLDSCETVVDGLADVVARLLAEAPGVTILTTSHEPLRAPAERVRRLAGLATPPEAEAATAAAALAYPAVPLFVDRVADHLDGFHLADADAPRVAEICRRLDSLPLAIELAATRVDTFGIAGVLAQIGQRFRPSHGSRRGTERHRALTAAIDWSYDLLTEAERGLLRRLAVFAGGFDLAAAVAIGSDDAAGSDAIADAIAGLVAKSLLAADLRSGDVTYRLLDTTRAYALGKLSAGGELEAARRRHALYCLDLVRQAGDAIGRLSRPDWAARYDLKVNDVRAALRWAFTDAPDPALGVRLTVAAIPFGRQIPLVEECRMAVARALTTPSNRTARRATI
jgi:predicted ATPase/DNA-binding winged helix-turn-helix (wHTH) protein